MTCFMLGGSFHAPHLYLEAVHSHFALLGHDNLRWTLASQLLCNIFDFCFCGIFEKMGLLGSFPSLSEF